MLGLLVRLLGRGLFMLLIRLMVKVRMRPRAMMPRSTRRLVVLMRFGMIRMGSPRLGNVRDPGRIMIGHIPVYRHR